MHLDPSERNEAPGQGLQIRRGDHVHWFVLSPLNPAAHTQLRITHFVLVTEHAMLSWIAGSGMGAAAVFERGDSVDELSNVRHIQSHNFLSKDAAK